MLLKILPPLKSFHVVLHSLFLIELQSLCPFCGIFDKRFGQIITKKLNVSAIAFISVISIFLIINFLGKRVTCTSLFNCSLIFERTFILLIHSFIFSCSFFKNFSYNLFFCLDDFCKSLVIQEDCKN